jgi:hypothetical protein
MVVVIDQIDVNDPGRGILPIRARLIRKTRRGKDIP